MFVHPYTMLNDEQNINASKRQEPFEHWVIFLQKALSVRCVRVAVPVGAPVLVHVALAMVVAVVVASMGLAGETTVTPLKWHRASKSNRNPHPCLAFLHTKTFCRVSFSNDCSLH